MFLESDQPCILVTLCWLMVHQVFMVNLQASPISFISH